jgi:carotenoid cleavage dioxygenase
MVHAVRIQGGTASYCNRWVQTSRLAQEEKAGWPVATKIGDYRGLASLAHMLLNKLARALGVLSAKDGLGTANTALAFHAGRLLALHEGDLPYQLRIACSGLVETLGRAAYE